MENKEKLTNEEENRKLLKLVEENPTLPIVFFVSSEDVCEDYSYTFLKNSRVEKGIIYESEISDRICVSESDYYDELHEYYSDSEDYADFRDENYDIEIQKLVDRAPHYEAIIVYINN